MIQFYRVSSERPIPASLSRSWESISLDSKCHVRLIYLKKRYNRVVISSESYWQVNRFEHTKLIIGQNVVWLQNGCSKNWKQPLVILLPYCFDRHGQDYSFGICLSGALNPSALVRVNRLWSVSQDQSFRKCLQRPVSSSERFYTNKNAYLILSLSSLHQPYWPTSGMLFCSCTWYSGILSYCTNFPLVWACILLQSIYW